MMMLIVWFLVGWFVTMGILVIAVTAWLLRG
jgi:hypothetical protein